MILYFDLDVGLNLGFTVELLFRLDCPVLAVVFNLVFAVVIGVASQVGWHVSCGSVDATEPLVRVLVLKRLILLNKVFSNGHVLSFNHMDDNSAL